MNPIMETEFRLAKHLRKALHLDCESKMEWISVRVKVPVENTDCLISDGVNVGFGYFVAEYEAEDPKDPTQYSSEHWIQEGLVLNTCCSGFPEVTHWMKLPNPPFKIALGRHDFPISDKCTTSQ